MKKVCMALVLIVVMSILSAPAAYAGSTTIDIGSPGTGAGYTFSGGVVTITDPGDYTITGNTIHNSLTVAGDIVGAVNLTLSGLSIRMADDRCPFSIGQNSSVNLILVGSNTIDPTNVYGANKRGISTSSGVSLTISGDGSLSVMGQSAAEAIGAEGNITINSGTVTASGGYSEGQSGKSGILGANITINGGSVTATGGHGYGMASSGLGGNSITINGGAVTAYGGTSEYIGSGAGIGGGANNSGGTIVINGGNVTATGGGRGAGIGGGSSGSGGNITINGGTVIANGGTDAAGIGGGYRGGGGTIIITNQNGNTHVTATGLNGGAGIGGGYEAGYVGGNGGYIAISGGTIEAAGGNNGSAGIGSGNYGGDGGNITISGGNVSATGGFKAAGIGGGEYFSGGTINITGGEVTANGGDQGAGIGSGCNVSGAAVKGGAITISGGTVNATGGVGGAGLGGGFDADGGSVVITGAAVIATGRGGGAGIGGGPNSTQWGNGGTITLNSGRVTAVSHGGGAGIGGGWMGNAGNITINGGLITASADDRAPGIGSGGSSVYVTQGTNSVTINAGRVYATGSSNSDIGGDGIMSYRTANTFNGGSIRAGSVNSQPKAGTADVYKTTVTVMNSDGSALADTDVTYSIDGGESISNVTDGSGKLYLWLPQTSGGGSTSILVSKGATEYSASGQVTNDNAAVMTAIEKTYVIGAISDQTLADLSEGYASGSQVPKTIRVTNTGTAALSNVSVSLEPGKDVYFELGVPSAAEIPVGGHADFTIEAKDAIELGDYTATITVQADRASNVSFTVSQKVKMLLIAFVNDGGSYAERSIHYNTSIGESGWPADPKKTGYTFSGWYTEANIRAIPSTVFTQPISLDAKWIANTYKVTFDAQEGTVSPEYKTVTYDETYGTLPTPLKPGYTFGGWYTEAGGTGQLITSSNTVKITSDITLYAKWTVNTYTVAYNANGGMGSTASSSHTYDTAKALTTNGFTRTGYTFEGWAESASDPIKYTDGQRVTNLSAVNGATVTLYAKWTANTYTVAYDANGGTGGTVSSSHTYDAAKALTTNGFSRTGYTFEGWAERASDPIKYTDGQRVTNLSAVNGATVMLYAKWTANTYTVAYDANGGTGGTALSSHTYDAAKALTANGFSRTGYKFDGWAENSSGPVKYTNEQSVMNLSAVSGATVTLYAKWTQYIFTVTFDTQNGSHVTPADYAYGSEASLPAAPARYGYDFSGWFYNAECSSPVSFPFTVTGNITLYAGWTLQDQSCYLKGVNLSSGTMNKVFSPTVTSYKINIGENDSSFTLSAFKQYDGTSMTMNKSNTTSLTVYPANGKNATITVNVKLGNKSKTYTFTVIRAKSANNNLGSLSVIGGSLDSGFDPDDTYYVLNLDENTKSTTIKATAVAGKIASVSPASQKVTLNNGAYKDVKITVKAQSGAKKVYTIHVVRASSTNASLKSLKVSVKGLTPVFNAGVTNYTLQVPTSAKPTVSVSISGKAAGYKAKVTVLDGAGSPVKKLNVAAGQAAIVKVVVTAQAGNTKEYMITIHR